MDYRGMRVRLEELASATYGEGDDLLPPSRSLVEAVLEKMRDLAPLPPPVSREIRRWSIEDDEHAYTLILYWDDALGLPGVYEALECPCCARTNLDDVVPDYIYDVDGWASSWSPDGHAEVRGVAESFRSELRRAYQEHYGAS